MAVDREFPALHRRLRWIQTELATVERQLEAESFQGISPNAYYQQSLVMEMGELDFILRYYQRQTNGALSRLQWLAVVGSMAISVVLLILLLLQRWP